MIKFPSQDVRILDAQRPLMDNITTAQHELDSKIQQQFEIIGSMKTEVKLGRSSPTRLSPAQLELDVCNREVEGLALLVIQGVSDFKVLGGDLSRLAVAVYPTSPVDQRSFLSALKTN
jgi:hypothetical protein